MSEQHPPTAAYSTVGATAHGSGSAPAPAPGRSAAQRAPRRQDPVGSLLLLVAGIAAGISLLLRWLADDDVTGLSLVRDGFSALGGGGVGNVLSTGYVQPLTVVLGGVVLFLLGLLLLVPARRHRAVGLLALVVALLVSVAVLVPLAIAGWDLSFFGVGFWFAIAVAVLGLLGAAKAILTR